MGEGNGKRAGKSLGDPFVLLYVCGELFGLELGRKWVKRSSGFLD